MSNEISFWDGVKTTDGRSLSPEEQLKFCEDFTQMLVSSPELAKIFFNTQVYNEIVNDVTTRGLHSEGVAIVAENLAMKKSTYDGKSKTEVKVAGLLSRALGYMHDLGHTPFGHDGEGALGKEMERFAATKDYKDRRKILFGEEYTIQADDVHAEVMCYEHNETSSIIGARLLQDFADKNGYVLDEQAIQYIKTGILAHSTSRVKKEPDGMEQKAVRLADKVAYIPQDLLDLLKQEVLSIDDLSPEEQGLLGLNEEQLTSEELKKYEDLESEETQKQYIERRARIKQEIKQNLRNLDKLSETEKLAFFGQLDAKVAEMQAEIAGKCFVDRNGEMALDGRKGIVDFFDKGVNKGEYPENHKITPIEAEGINLFSNMRDAQKHRVQVGTKINDQGEEEPVYEPIPPEKQKQAIDETSQAYCQFLQEKYGMNPMMATLWVTKAKYQDAFINGELTRETQDKNGKVKSETLGDINKRNDNGWKMKTTFQFFYSNMDQIPQDFRDKYQGEKNDLYTDQQMVSAFIASFTNKGLDELYQGLLDRHLVISRDEAIKQLQVQRPDLDVASLVEESKKWVDPQNNNEKHKVPANDVLEFLYEENVGRSIVAGKNRVPEKTIPPIQHTIAVRDGVEATAKESQGRAVDANLLSSAIDVSKTEVNSQDIQKMVEGVISRQNSQEIQQHIDEVNKGTNEGR